MNHFMYRALSSGLSTLLLGLFVPTPVRAGTSDLAEVFPENTLVYIGRSGCDQTDAACRLTAFGKTLTDPQVERFTEQVWTAINDALARQFPKKKGEIQHAALQRVLETLGRRPVAIGVIDGGLGERGPFAQAALVVHVGKEAETFLSDVDVLFTIKGVPATQPVEATGQVTRQIMLPVPGGAYYGLVKDYFIFAIDEQTIQKIGKQLGSPKTSLAKNAALVASRKKIGGNDRSRILSVFVNVSRVIEVLKRETAHQDSSTVEKWFAGLFSVGENLNSFCWEKHYRDRGCYDAMYLYVPGKGAEWSLSSAGKTLSDDDLSIIPQSPSWATVCQVDLSAVWDKLVSFVEPVDPKFHQEILNGVKKLEDKLGFSIDEDFLKLVGPVIILYDAPENGGFLFSGITIVVESSDAKKLQESLRKVVEAIQKEVGEEPKIAVSSFEHNHHRVEFVNVAAPMPIAPAWSSHGKWVVVGLYPQMVTTALDRFAEGSSKRESILDNPDVIAAKKSLGELGSSFSYVDTKAAWEQLYSWALLVAQMGAGAAQGEGAKIDISSFPTQAGLTRHLFADIGTTRVDPDGVLYASYGPMPVGTMPMLSSNIATTATLVSVLLPSLSRARELSKRTVCAANMRGIGQAMYIHAQDGERFPPDFETLIKENNATPRQFVCPSSDATEGDLNACYIYVTGQTISDAPDNVLVYEKPGCHQNEGGNVLFQDSHVEFVKPYSRIEELLEKTKERIAAERKRLNEKEKP